MVGSPVRPFIVIVIGAEVGDVFPPTSVRVDKTLHTPSDNAGSVQSAATPTTYEHDTVVDPLVAMIVTVSPAVPPAAESVGVLSLVMLSVFDAPVSEPADISAELGATGTPESMMMVSAPDGADVLPAASTTVAVTVHVPSASMGRVQPVDAPTV